VGELSLIQAGAERHGYGVGGFFAIYLVGLLIFIGWFTWLFMKSRQINSD
jgi:hypothetical protein